MKKSKTTHPSGAKSVIDTAELSHILDQLQRHAASQASDPASMGRRRFTEILIDALSGKGGLETQLLVLSVWRGEIGPHSRRTRRRRGGA